MSSRLLSVIITAIVGPVLVLLVQHYLETSKETLFVGQVKDERTSLSVPNAKLTFEAQTHPSPVESDAHGAYFFRAKKGLPDPLRVTVQANGYTPQQHNVTLATDGYFATIYLVSEDPRSSITTTTTTSTSTLPQARRSSRVQVAGPFNVEAGGCQDSQNTFSVEAPGELDFSRGGQGLSPPGWEIELQGNGSHGIRNVSASGRTLHFTLHAEGGGGMTDIPFLGRQCFNPTGANSAAVIYVWMFTS